MAIGDAVSDVTGTGTETRQPSSGVEEKITAIAKQGATDTVSVTNGTDSVEIVGGAITQDADAGASHVSGMLNMAVMITNGFYISKGGTTDRAGLFGVQTNA
jgi:hypothetical protein